MTSTPNRARARAIIDATNQRLGRRPRLEAAKALIGYSATSAAFVALDIKGEITDEAAARIERQLRAAPRANTIHMTINSNGGDESAMWRIFNAIRRHSAKRKIASGLGQVASAAVTILAAADVRRVYPGTKILMHAVESPPHSLSRWTAAEHDAHARTLRIKDERVANELAARCGKPVAIFMARLADERPTPLVEALSLGLVHEIVGETMPLRRDWPKHARAALQRGAAGIYGAGAWRFSEPYMAACEISGI